MSDAAKEQCADCQAALVPKAKFCAHCGSPIRQKKQEAELRQLTVMFCDLVGSTVLSDRLDPEELRKVTSAYHAASSEVIERYGGHVAQYLGDGILVYFGYPKASEEDPRHAVQTALEIVDALRTLNGPLQTEHQIELKVRIGIHTGPVVVGEVGEGSHRENLALGRTPNVAARVQSFAQPDIVLITEETHRIVQGFFDCQFVGEHQLKGIEAPVRMYQPLRESGARSRLEAERRIGLTKFTGRKAERDTLTSRWREATQSDTRNHAVLISGEAGIGKSRFVAHLQEQALIASHRIIECACLVDYQHSTLHPISMAIERYLDFKRSTSDADKWALLTQLLKRWDLYTPERILLMAKLLHVEPPEGTAPLSMPPANERKATLALVHQLIVSSAQETPTVLIIEDLHWADPTTIEVLQKLTAAEDVQPLLLVLTHRSDFDAPFAIGDHVSELTLERLDVQDTEAIISHVTKGKKLPDVLLSELIERCEGVPLFAEELTKAVLELDVLEEGADSYILHGALPPDLVPATVQGSLSARLDQMGPAKFVAQRAAVFGREFRLDVLQTVTAIDYAELIEGLNRLKDAELIYQLDEGYEASYQFKHALIQDAAYQSLLKEVRREQHLKIAQALTRQFADISARRPELAAHHFENGGDADLSAAWWFQAGKRALARAAGHEARAHISKSLEQLSLLEPCMEVYERELGSLGVLTTALQTTDGWASKPVEEACRRSSELLEKVGDVRRQAQVMSTRISMHTLSGRIEAALELTKPLVELNAAIPNNKPMVVSAAHASVCVVQLYHGDIDDAIDTGDAALSLITPEGNQWMAERTGLAPEVNTCAYLAEAWWMRGRYDRALYYSDHSLAVARDMRHEPSEELAINNQAQFYQMEGNVDRVIAVADETLRLATQRRSAFWLPMVTVYQGWAKSVQGDHAGGIEMMLDGLAAYRKAGNGITQVHMGSFIAEAQAKAGRWQEALATFAETEKVSAQTGERYYLPELYRLRADLRWHYAREGDAEERRTGADLALADLQKALAIAQQQKATSLELRSAMSLLSLQRDQGEDLDPAATRIKNLLAQLPHGVPGDLEEAQALLNEGMGG